MNKLPDEIKKQLEIYNNTIMPIQTIIKETKRKLPLEMLESVENIFSTLCTILLFDKRNTINLNYNKLETYMRKLSLNCYRNYYLLVSEQRKCFYKKHSKVDLTYINKGQFLMQERLLYKACKQSYKKAEKAERNNLEYHIILELYKDVYNRCETLYTFLQNFEDEAEYLKAKATYKNILEIIFGVIGAIGTIITIIGLVI